MKKLITSVKRSSKALVLGSLMLGATASFAQDNGVSAKSPLQVTQYRGSNAYSGVVRIRFKNDRATEMKLAKLIKQNPNGKVTSRAGAMELSEFPELSAKNQKFGAVSMRRVFRPAGKFEEKHKAAGLHLWYEIQVENAADLGVVLNEYSKVADVSVVEPRYEMSLNVLNGAPNDPQYSTQANHYDLINAVQAWGLETGSADVVVAIEDQGVDYNHPDLAGHMWTNSGEVPGNGVDDDNNGYVDDYYGYNFGDNSGNIAIDYHGTHVGGTVSAETNNGVGVSGVAGGSGSNDGVRLMSLSVFGASSQGGFDEAFIYAADNGAVISQNSWGGGSTSAALENAIDYFIANAGGAGQPLNGGLVVFAAGNSNSQSTGSYPGRYAPVVAVASTTFSAARSSFSNYGTWVDIAAPGSNIRSTYPVSQGSYNSISGTSMACPHVSGVAALVASKYWREGNPLTAAQLRNILETSANFDLLYNANSSTYDGKLGSGMVDAFAALGGSGGGGGGGDACGVPSGLSSSAITSTSFTVSWGAVSGASSYDVEVNGSVVSSNTTGTSVNLTGASANTTYAVKVRANCSASSSDYSGVLNVTTSGASTGCAGGVSSFPYSESFESGLGAWSQGSGDDLNWSRDANGTPSRNTGPSSGSSGSYYMYVEASSPNYPSKTAYFNSPCFDLSGESQASFGFSYHMNGSSMGSLVLQASSNGGASWSSIWSKSGSQGTAWRAASVDLAAYVGSDVQLRFVGTTGSSWSSDIAVDGISVSTNGGGGGGSSVVTLTLKLDQYPSETAWSLRDANGATVANGGNYSSANSTVTRTFDLPAGCYDFVITDSYGDGICCQYGNGFYTLSDASGTLASGGSFTSSETKNFCVGGANSINNVATVTRKVNAEFTGFDFEVYPNPATSSISFSLSGAKEVSYLIYNMTGQRVKVGVITHNGSVALDGLAKGIYFVKAQVGEEIVTKKIVKE